MVSGIKTTLSISLMIVEKAFSIEITLLFKTIVISSRFLDPLQNSTNISFEPTISLNYPTISTRILMNNGFKKKSLLSLFDLKMIF